ncbi:MAG: histidine kinase dimerization/phospho-acceptor domain-containing protein, partial [Exilispira sp.]
FQNKCIFALNNALYHILRKSEKLIFNNKLVYLGDYLIETDKFKIIEKINYKNLIKIKIESTNLKVYSIYCQSLFKYLNSLSNKTEDDLYLFIFIDKTDLTVKKIETKKLLESSNNISRRLDILINNLNHEIRTPINIISGYIELMKYENLDEFAISKLNEIIFYIDNINIIIKDIISISSYVNDEKNIVEINLNPTLIDFKNFIDRSCLFSCNIDIPDEEKIIVKINLLIFKRLFYFIIDSYKNNSNLQFNIKIVTPKKHATKKSATLILSLREKDKINNYGLNEISQTTKIVLEHLVFILNGQIRFYSSIYNFDIKIPIEI